MKVANAAGGGSLEKLWKTFKVLFLIIILMLVYFPTSLFWGYVYYSRVMQDKLTASYVAWIGCQLANFAGVYPCLLWLFYCGAHVCVVLMKVCPLLIMLH